MEAIKRAFSHVFTRDVRHVEPTKTGLMVGENVRIYKEGDGYVVSFLKGTDRPSRTQIAERLDMNNVAYTLGKDFSN